LGKWWILALNKYYRLLRDVAPPDECVLNRELVREEFSWWYRKHAAGDTARERLEREAREARKSLSDDLSPVPGQLTVWVELARGIEPPTCGLQISFSGFA
jgi:hypothetical protein